ncbi:MAG TPA: hypothetical protein VES67_17395 [Vicinamibacterales bacterium]|nr:hypothetical protein [Vicinamibacterales bacterium]
MNGGLAAGWPFARRELVAVLLGFLVTLPFVTTRIYASDEVQYFAWLRSAAFDRDVDFENEYQYFHDAGVARGTGFHETFLVKRNEAGHRENYGPIGSAVLWAPFYAMGHMVAILTGAPANGFSQPYISAVSLGSAIYGCLAVLLSAAIARRVVGPGLAASLLVCFATPLVFYIYIAPPMSHANSAFAVALFLWVWLRIRQRWTLAGMVCLGVTGALMTMVRDQDVFFAAGPALDFLRQWGRAAKTTRVAAARSWGVAAGTGVVAFAVAYTPQLLASTALHGHVGPSQVVARKMSWTSPHALEVLFSPSHGFFAWTPLALLAVVGLALLAAGRVSGSTRSSEPDARWIGTLALVMMGLQAYVSGAVESWTVAGSFGQRRFVGLTPLLTLGIASLMGAVASLRSRTATAAVVVAFTICLWWNAGLMVQFGTNTMDRQRLTLRENAWSTFVVLPREVPTLVWRYLTDRASFYNQPRR